MMLGNSPDETVDKEISGADTTRRYLYQAAYGALQSVQMIDEKSEIQEVYCEQMEDILLKIIDGSFIGIQVKTQDEVKGGFKFGDEPVLKAIARFVNHEHSFPGKFKRYQICTNCGFVKGKDASDLAHCIRLIVEKKGVADECYEATDFSKYVKKIAVLSKISDEALILGVISKIELFKWAGLRDYKRVLESEIGQLLKAEHQPYIALIRAAEVLTDVALHAGEFSDKQTQPAYHLWINDPVTAMANYIIGQKRIEKKTVTDAIEKCFNMTGLLRGIMPVSIKNLPPSMDILSQKLQAGNVAALDVQTMKDCDNSALALLFEWYNASDANEANARYDHLRIIMQRECSYAYNSAFSEDDSFGQKMLGIVRDRIIERQPEIIRRYNDCSCEHMEGIAGILTELCSVWWSKQFKLRENVQNGPV
jgi:ABC-type transporter Mla MlaB component